MFLCSNALSLCGIALIPLASSGLRARLCVQQQNLCARHTTGTKCEEKERERMVFDPLWPKELVGVKSGKHKRRRKRRKKNQKKKRKKAKRVVQTPSPALEKGRLSPFQFYFFINNYTCVCLLCLRERERGRVRSEQHSSLKIHAHAYRSNKGSIDLETRATSYTDIS